MLKYNLLSCIVNIVIGLKSGNPFTDFLHYTGNFKRYFTVYSNCCTQTKVSDKVLGLCRKCQSRLNFVHFSCPYVGNESAYHTGTFNNATYFDKIDAIKNGDIDTFNELLQNEGISKWDLDDFEELYDNYESFISKANKELGGSIDATYGIKGIAAEGGDMSGGAGQIVTPFCGDVLEKIGILKEN